MPEVPIQNVIKIGNSLGVAIPAVLCRALNLKRGQRVTFLVQRENEIIVRLVSRDEIKKLRGDIIE